MTLRQQIPALMFFVVIGCSPPESPSLPAGKVSAADLSGQWELRYDGKTIFDKSAGVSIYGKGVETLTLLPNGKFEQMFYDSVSGSYPKTEGTWHLSTSPSGQRVVVLSGLRQYKDGITSAVALPPPKSTALVVEVSSPMPFGKRRELILCFDDPDVNLCFSRITKEPAGSDPRNQQSK